RGQQVRVETYLESRPELRDQGETFALVYDELLSRQERGEVSLDEYFKRFPQFAERLARQMQGSSGSSDVTLPPASHPVTPATADRDPGRTAAEQAHGETPADGKWFNLQNTADWGARPGSHPASAGEARPSNEGTMGRAPNDAPDGVTTGPYVSPSRVRQVLPWAVGKYAIARELGRGGMGVVYHANDELLKRPVALKMILAADYADQEAIRRFRIEAEAVARLKHSNIVQIYEIGEQQGKPYFALEYLDGGSLKERIGGKPQPPRMAASTIKILADAIHYAHEHGIIHRDLKPGNILYADDGTPKITDFGLAKLDPNAGPSAQTKVGAKGVTKSGDMIGTPSYMAPEQVEGKSGTI